MIQKKNETQRKAREARNKEVVRFYEHEDGKRMTEGKQKLGGMRRKEADKKSKIHPLLGPRSRGEKSVLTKTSWVKFSSISFKSFLDLLEATFVK